MLDALRHSLGVLTVILLIALVVRARLADPHNGGELRETLWPSYRRHRRWANAAMAAMSCVVLVGAVATWLPLPPGIALGLECFAALVSVYCAIGAIVVHHFLQRLARRCEPCDEPGATLLIYAASWPTWYGSVRDALLKLSRLT